MSTKVYLYRYGANSLKTTPSFGLTDENILTTQKIEKLRKYSDNIALCELRFKVEDLIGIWICAFYLNFVEKK